MTNSEPTTLRMAFSFRGSISDSKLDPAKVDTIAKAHLVRMLYSRLVEYTPEGQLTGSMAESFRVEGRKAIFKIRNGLKTASGVPIGAEDVAISFRRLLVKNSNTHGRLELFVCVNGDTIKDVTEKCDGISINGNEVIFEMHEGVSPSFFIPMLASTDFSIIPKAAIDLTNEALPIQSYAETSGLYYLAKNDPVEFRHEFAINPNHPQFSTQHASKIQAEPVYGAQAVTAMLEGKVEFIPSTSYLSAAGSEQLQEKFKGEIQLHATHPIQLHSVMFTKRGLSELKVEQRISLGAKIKAGYLEAFADVKLQPTDQIFPALGEGALNAAELTEITTSYDVAMKGPLSAGKFVLGVAPGDVAAFQKVLGASAEKDGPVELREMIQAPWTVELAKQPHAYVSTQDSAFFEDISLVAYGMQHGFLDSENGDAWIRKYISTEDKSARMVLLRQLHFQSLKMGLIVPLGVAPYRAAAKAPWTMNFPRFFAGSPLWMLQKN